MDISARIERAHNDGLALTLSRTTLTVPASAAEELIEALSEEDPKRDPDGFHSIEWDAHGNLRLLLINFRPNRPITIYAEPFIVRITPSEAERARIAIRAALLQHDEQTAWEAKS